MLIHVPYIDLLAVLGIGAVIGSIVYKMRWLTPAGALLGGLFGAHAVVQGGAAWAVPLLAFVASGSLIGRLFNKAPADVMNKDEGPRTAVQVMANGGWAWAALALTPWIGAEWTYPAFAGSLAAATADTWGTEIGTRWRSSAWSLRSGQRVQAGVSGAVSSAGTVAGVVGAGTIGVLAAVLGSLSAAAAAWITLGGIVGSLVDSILGATLQAQYASADGGDRTDAPESQNATLVQGSTHITNNSVNGIATLVGTFFGLASALLRL